MVIRMDNQGALDEEVVGKAFDRALFRQLWAFAGPHRRAVALAFSCLVVLFGLELCGPWIVRMLMDGPVRDAVSGEAVPDTNAVLKLALAYLVVVTGVAGLRLAQAITIARAGQRIVLDIRCLLFQHLQRLGVGWFDRHASGAVTTRVISDVENLNDLFTSGVIQLVFDLVKVAVVIGVLFAIHAPLAWWVLALLPLLAAVSGLFRWKARSTYRQVRAWLARCNAYLSEAIQGMDVVHLFGRERAVARRFDRRLDGCLEANLETVKWFGLFWPALDLLVISTQACVLLVGGQAIAQDQLSFGAFLQFWMCLEFLFAPIRELGEKYNVLQSAFASGERIFAVLDAEPEPAVPAEAQVPEIFRGALAIEDVSFSYDDRTPVLENISIDVEPGATLALVGATGAGKSTLVDLLLRLRDPVRGRILLDGVDLRDFDVADLRRRVASVPQDAFLFADTLDRNVDFGRGLDAAAVEDALAAAGATRIAARVGEDHLTERGASLSTGERQILAVARALAGDPELVILDEATAHMDSESERLIQDACARLLTGRTAVVVAHRLSTVQNADRIAVLHHGRLEESGTHGELVAANGLYRRLVDLQLLSD